MLPLKIGAGGNSVQHLTAHCLQHRVLLWLCCTWEAWPKCVCSFGKSVPTIENAIKRRNWIYLGTVLCRCVDTAHVLNRLCWCALRCCAAECAQWAAHGNCMPCSDCSCLRAITSLGAIAMQECVFRCRACRLPPVHPESVAITPNPSNCAHQGAACFF